MSALTNPSGCAAIGLSGNILLESWNGKENDHHRCRDRRAFDRLLCTDERLPNEHLRDAHESRRASALPGNGRGIPFDISMHNVAGSRSGPYNQIWQELGALKDRRFFYHQELGRIEAVGKKLDITSDLGLVRDQMLALSPGDADLTKEFIKLLSSKTSIMDNAPLDPEEASGVVDKIRTRAGLLPLLPVFAKYGGMTVQDFAQRFRDPFLRNAVRFFIDAPGWPMPRFPLVALAGYMKALSQLGAPIGGSQQVILQIEKFYTQLGGDIRFGSRAVDVIVRNDRAVGVRLADGSEHYADIVIWAGDGHTLIFDMLKGRYAGRDISDMYENWIPVKPLLHVALGVDRDMSKEPHRIIFELDKPISTAGEEHTWMSVLHHSFDPTMAPPGKSAVEVWYATRYDYWERLAQNRAAYEAQKKRIAEVTIRELDKRWPGFATRIEVVDVPTPATYVRYTGNWQGSPDGWYITLENMNKRRFIRTLPGLSGLYMAGQWTAPFTGVALAALSGRQLIQILCRQDKKAFVTDTRGMSTFGRAA